MWIFFLSFCKLKSIKKTIERCCSHLSLGLFSTNADLVIRPSEQILIRDQFRSFVALCSNQSKSQVHGWRSPQRHEIPANENDRSVFLSLSFENKSMIEFDFLFSVTIERQIHGIRLRIRNLTIDDQGIQSSV